MVKVKRGIPLASMERLLKNVGAKRVSESAKKALREALDDYGNRVGLKAIKLAKHAGRTTIRDKDIKLALKE